MFPLSRQSNYDNEHVLKENCSFSN